MKPIEHPQVLYSCYHQKSSKGENFVPYHTISYLIAGTFILADGKQQYPSMAGSLHLIRRNQLVKFIKYPPENGKYESLNIYLNEDLLKELAAELKLSAIHKPIADPIVALQMNNLLQNYLTTLSAIVDTNKQHSENLVDVKARELVILLLQSQPALKDILFDFSVPHKIDLESFMIQNYKYNVKLERFAYLTGRSLATFKRDFEKIFDTSPHKWILQKRLSEAHFLLKEMGKSASDIYLDLGFEDLSHFSYAFKKYYGYSLTKAALA